MNIHFPIEMVGFIHSQNKIIIGIYRSTMATVTPDVNFLSFHV